MVLPRRPHEGFAKKATESEVKKAIADTLKAMTAEELHCKWKLRVSHALSGWRSGRGPTGRTPQRADQFRYAIVVLEFFVLIDFAQKYQVEYGVDQAVDMFG